MFTKRNDEEQSHWVSFTDLVSGFMIVFIVVSLVALGQIKPEETIPAPIPELEAVKTDSIVSTPEGKYKEMVEVFREKLKGIEAVEIADSATIRFSVPAKSNSPLFRSGEPTPTTYFRNVLDSFIPIYYEELLKIYNEEKKPNAGYQVIEIRIEGHTDPDGDYMHNLDLSSKRASAIQQYLLDHEKIKQADTSFQRYMEDKTIACGYSFSRTLNYEGGIVERNSENVNKDKSRRVEFRILLEYQKPTTHEN